mgnify:CR=1 FL=1
MSFNFTSSQNGFASLNTYSPIDYNSYGLQESVHDILLSSTFNYKGNSFVDYDIGYNVNYFISSVETQNSFLFSPSLYISKLISAKQSIGFSFLHYFNYESISDLFLDIPYIDPNYYNSLTENLEASVSFYNEVPISVDLPNQVNCKIKSTDVALKGQTVSSSYKPAVLENGLSIQVPPFIESGDEVIIDTRNLEYIKKI